MAKASKTKGYGRSFLNHGISPITLVFVLSERTSAATRSLLCAAGKALLQDEFGAAFLTAQVSWSADTRTLTVEHMATCPGIKNAHRAYKSATDARAPINARQPGFLNDFTI